MDGKTKKIGCAMSLTCSVVLSLMLAPAIAQNAGDTNSQGDLSAQHREQKPEQTDSHSMGTSPAGTGSTGWTGGTGSAQQANPNVQQLQTNGQASAQPYVPTPGPVEGQPWMATGLDLKGPPTRFPANKTPE